jgi:hypothetical protein
VKRRAIFSYLRSEKIKKSAILAYVDAKMIQNAP